MKDDGYDAMFAVGLKPGGDIGFEVALLLEEAKEAPAILFDRGGVVRRLRSVIRDLNQT